MKTASRLLLVLILFGACAPTSLRAAAPREKPNLIVILADDLGYGDLSCYGQKLYKTPRLDAMAAAGMRFTQFYAGSPIGSPSRSVFLTGLHGGRTPIRGNTEQPIAITKDQLTIASLLKSAGYSTGCVGKWGVGAPQELTNPNDVGFGHFFGWVHRRHAENAYPEFLIRNGSKVKLNNVVEHSKDGSGVATERREFAQDLLIADALQFVRENKDKPFFLLYAPQFPGVSTEVPDVSEFATKEWPAAEKKFAAAVQLLDRDTGRILDALEELGLAKETLVLFTSDNGPHKNGGHDPDFFDSNVKFRGIKGDIREGGIRVPAIACWPGTVAANSTNDHQWYVGDVMATAAELSGVPRPASIDSDSLIPVLKGTPPKGQWDRKSPLYWEIYEGQTAQAVRFGKWKAIRSPIFTGPVELYDLSWDMEEKRDHPRRADLVKHATNLLNKNHQPNPNWRVPEPETTARGSQP